MDSPTTDQRHEKLRVLIVAEHASTRFGGEAFLPVQYFRVLRARGHEVWMLGHARTQDDLRSTFADDQDRLAFVRDLTIQRVLAWASHQLPDGLPVFTTGALSHLITQVMQRRMAKRLVTQHRIDLVYEPVPVSPKQPSAMWNVGAPVVMGPFNGGMSFPAAFTSPTRRLKTWGTAMARLSADVANRLIPGKRKAALLMVANQRTRKALPKSVRNRPVAEMVENGVDLGRFSLPPARRPSQAGSLRLVYVGRLVPLKAVDLLLEALAQLPADCDACLDVLGDGNQRPRLQALAEQLGVAERVRFHGFMPQAEVATQMGEADALVLPSLRECGGAVVLEAMAMALPVIAADWGGPADYLDASCGMLVTPSSRADFVAGLRDAIAQLAASPARRRELGEAGRRRVIERYDWERKVDRMLELWADVVHARIENDHHRVGARRAGPGHPAADARSRSPPIRAWSSAGRAAFRPSPGEIASWHPRC